MSQDRKTTKAAKKTKAPRDSKTRKKPSFSPFSRSRPDKKEEEEEVIPVELPKSIPPPPPPAKPEPPVVLPVVKPAEKPKPVEKSDVSRDDKIKALLSDLMFNGLFTLSRREALRIAVAMVDVGALSLLKMKEYFTPRERQKMAEDLAAKHNLKM